MCVYHGEAVDLVYSESRGEGYRWIGCCSCCGEVAEHEWVEWCELREEGEDVVDEVGDGGPLCVRRDRHPADGVRPEAIPGLSCSVSQQRSARGVLRMALQQSLCAKQEAS